MIKYNIKTAFAAICLALVFLFFNMVFVNFISEWKSKTYSENQFQNLDMNFISNTVSFVPFSSVYEEWYDNDIDYIASLSTELTPYGYKGFISPSRIYYAQSNVGIKGEFPSFYVLEQNYLSNYELQIEKTIEFNHTPATLNDITVYLGYPYKAILGDNDTIDIVIFQKTNQETYTISAKVVGYIKPNQYDPINQTDMHNIAYIGNIQPLFEKDITYNSKYRMYSLCFANLQNNASSILGILSDKGAVVNFEYSAEIISNIQEYKDSLPFNIIFIVIIMVSLSFSVFIYIYELSSIYNDYRSNKNAKLFNNNITVALTSLIIIGILNTIYIFIIGTIPNMIILLIPYLITIGLVAFIIINSKLMLKKEQKND